MRVRLTSLGIVLAALAAAACSSNGSEGTGTQGTGGSGGSGGQTGSTSSNGGTGGSSSQATSSSSDATSTSQSSSTGGSADPYEAARVACMDKINALRATKSLPAYGRWKDAEACVDQQATYDEMNNDPHGAWSGGVYPSCNGNAQNECLGAGPNGIEGCLQQMWDEKNQPDCAGCDACADAFNPNCPNCDFFGQKNGQVCGHYVNMSAKYLSEAACGFSSLGGWDAINFR
jgi:hypothetical protein